MTVAGRRVGFEDGSKANWVVHAVLTGLEIHDIAFS